MSHPVLPAPTTSTRLPRSTSALLYWRRVHDLAVELPRDLGHLRPPVVPVGDHDGVDAPGPGSGRTHRRHVPGRARVGGVDRLDPGHPRAHLDASSQVEVVGVAPQVLPHLALVRVVGPVVGHREVGVLREGLGGDGVRALVDAARRAVDVPVAPHLVGHVEAGDVEAGSDEVLHRGQPDPACSDHRSGRCAWTHDRMTLRHRDGDVNSWHGEWRAGTLAPIRGRVHAVRVRTTALGPVRGGRPAGAARRRAAAAASRSVEPRGRHLGRARRRARRRRDPSAGSAARGRGGGGGAASSRSDPGTRGQSTTARGPTRRSWPTRWVPITPQRLDAESEELRWVRLGEVTRLPLHSGFAAAWPSVQPLLHRREVVVVDAANVVGSTPDGWWNDRVGAAQRLLDVVSDVAVRGLIAQPPAQDPDATTRPAGRCGRQDASVAALDRRAGGRGERRRRLAARTGRASARFRRRRGGRVSAAREHAGTHVTVVTADRELRQRVEAGCTRRRPADAHTAVLSAQALFSRRLLAASTLCRKASIRSTTSASSPSAAGGITISRPSTLDATSSSIASRYSSV